MPPGRRICQDSLIADGAYRFGIARLTALAGTLEREARRIEEYGFDFVCQSDHLGGPAPFSILSAVAAVTERLRLRTYVLNASFWNPAMLAREAATLDRLSNGRLELGLGAGTVPDEFEAAGVKWRPARERIGRMQRTLLEVRERLADPSHSPRPVQDPVPMLVGAMSRDGLAVAADHADIVGYSALRHAAGQPAGTLAAGTADETDDLVAFARKRAKGRSFESDVLLQSVELGSDPLKGAKAYLMREGEPGDPRVLAESPCVLFARSASDAAAELERRRARWGFTSFTTFAPSTAALAEVRRELT